MLHKKKDNFKVLLNLPDISHAAHRLLMSSVLKDREISSGFQNKTEYPPPKKPKKTPNPNPNQEEMKPLSSYSFMKLTLLTRCFLRCCRKDLTLPLLCCSPCQSEQLRGPSSCEGQAAANWHQARGEE